MRGHIDIIAELHHTSSMPPLRRLIDGPCACRRGDHAKLVTLNGKRVAKKRSGKVRWPVPIISARMPAWRRSRRSHPSAIRSEPL